MTRPLRVRIAGGHHTHTARPSPDMTGRLRTDCGKTKWQSRFDYADGPVTCPGCLKASAKAAG